VRPGVLSDVDIESLAQAAVPLMVHGLQPDESSAKLVATLSKGQITSVGALRSGYGEYQGMPDSGDVCEAFAGLSFGPAHSEHDRILALCPSSTARILICCHGEPFLASVHNKFFLASADVADIDAAVGEAPLTDYFSRFVPYAMVLRHLFGAESWRPASKSAAVIIDDPLLRNRYGFMDYGTLHRLVQEYNFHATIAFIPHNFRRSASQIVNLFRQNPQRLSICFHGNDHTGAELAAKDIALLNTMLQIAGRRMDAHRAKTGLVCDRVMVFPQGNFSVEAMDVLKAHNFEACVNTSGQPTGQPVALSLRELAQPAVLRYAGFPLFLRSKIPHTQRENIAFSLFFGKPVLIVAHHDAFERPQDLIEVVNRINAVAPGIAWSNLSTVVKHSFWERTSAEGIRSVRAFGEVVQTSVPESRIKWASALSPDSRVLREPGTPPVFRLEHPNPHPVLQGLGFQRQAKAFIRRRLSEVRDNYLSQNPRILAAAKALQRRLSHQIG
jgi:hypothetical protein